MFYHTLNAHKIYHEIGAEDYRTSESVVDPSEIESFNIRRVDRCIFLRKVCTCRGYQRSETYRIVPENFLAILKNSLAPNDERRSDFRARSVDDTRGRIVNEFQFEGGGGVAPNYPRFDLTIRTDLPWIWSSITIISAFTGAAPRV